MSKCKCNSQNGLLRRSLVPFISGGDTRLSASIQTDYHADTVYAPRRRKIPVGGLTHIIIYGVTQRQSSYNIGGKYVAASDGFDSFFTGVTMGIRLFCDES